ncbi:Hypothetical Protein FCC1311_117842 [Hondaea fermentalgiana]|uniref:Uncharacterized protein n=1 Tax=Hondaea fermentalgiana TaxID=2315210 RepID=A0A2R5FF13_9STRA|nr:Hypothetical Protein FCC1311_117842 [Hondaea fermentalgiana]|eukprot:GBG16309.1 Hypothetical Protein FCC1311_117842 [Hondaea fermentalgiana]
MGTYFGTLLLLILWTLISLLFCIPGMGMFDSFHLRTSNLVICPASRICANATHYWDWHNETYAELSLPYFSSTPVYSIYISEESIPPLYTESTSLGETYEIANELYYFGDVDHEFSRATICQNLSASWEAALVPGSYAATLRMGRLIKQVVLVTNKAK